MRRRLAVPVLALGVIWGCGDDGGGAAAQRADQIRTAAADAGLPDEVGDLLASAAASVGEVFRVTYELGGDAGGTAVVTQDPPRRRVDLNATVGGRPVTRALLVDGEEATVCERVDARWACRAGGSDDEIPGAFGDAQVDQAVRDLEAARGAYDFRLAGREVAGVEARCLVTELRPGRRPTADLGRKGTLCLSPEGVPLLVETPVASLRAVRYEREVDGAAFRAPAEVRR